MSQTLNTRHHDVVVIGGGSAGIAAAVASAKSGAEALLVEAGPILGGDPLSGLLIDGVAKGGHHIDIHGSGTHQKRTPVKDGRPYDIPYGCLVPRTLSNVLVAGRCLSSTREVNGSARTMGQCMSTGEAAGTAAAMCVECGWDDVRQVPVQDLRQALRAQGAVIDGTH